MGFNNPNFFRIVRLIFNYIMTNKDFKCSMCRCYRYQKDFMKNGRILKTCSTCRISAAKYRNRYLCPHGVQRYFCKTCTGGQICKHEIQKSFCKSCTDPIKVVIMRWIGNCKEADKKYNRYDADRFIDKCFLKGLIEDSRNRCRYCEKKIQYTKYTDDLATIERLDNRIGHIKSNCVITCRSCNLQHKD